MYAVLDLGSNSFHLVVANAQDTAIQIVHTQSSKVQLAEGLERGGKISAKARARAMDALRDMKASMDRLSVTRLCVVGTNAFREAQNAAQLISDIATLGFDVNVVSGIQEAYYIYSGAHAFLPDEHGMRLVFDIGGGSTEFALGAKEDAELLDSLPLGCVALASGEDDKVSRKSLARLRRKAHKILDKHLSHHFYELEWSECYASSGTAKMLSQILQETGLSEGTITETALQALETLVIEKGYGTSLEKLPGLKAARRNVFASGLAIMQSVIDHLGIDHVDHSPFALREGVLLNMIRKPRRFQLNVSAYVAAA